MFNQSKKFNVSGALYSQHFSKDLIKQFLVDQGIWTWRSNFNLNEFQIETWHNGLWIKQVGLLSYAKLADFLYRLDYGLGQDIYDRGEVKRISNNIWEVKGTQKNHYAVFRDRAGSLSCECMKFKMRKNRLDKECPPLFKGFGSYFCHHTLAVQFYLDEYEDIFGRQP